MNKKPFLFFFLILITTINVFAYSCEQYTRPGVDAWSMFTMDCAGTSYTSIQDELGNYDQGIAGDEGKYAGRGGTGQGFITNIFDNNPNNQEYVFLDMSGDATNTYHVTVLQFINGSTVKSYETTVTADGTVTISHNTQPELFDLNNDGRQELVFLGKDGSTSTLFMYGLNASNEWEGGEIASLGWSDAWQYSKIMCMSGTRPGYTFNGRFCMVLGDGQNYLTGYKYDGSKAFSVDINTNDFFKMYSSQILINDINNDGTMELVGLDGDYIKVITESGSLLYTSDEENTGCGKGAVGYQVGSINNVKYLAYDCPNSDTGKTYIHLLYNDLTTAWNKSITSTSTTSRHRLSGTPLFMQGEDVICFPYALASDNKLSYKCYDTVGNLDSTTVSSSITVNNDYYQNENLQQMFDYSIPQGSDEVVKITPYHAYVFSDTGSISLITDFSNLYETGSYASTISYKPPAIGDMDCDDKLDLVMTVCDSDQSPCDTRMFLSSNGTESCDESGVIIGNNTVQCYRCYNNYLQTTYFTNVCDSGWSTTPPESCAYSPNITTVTTCYQCANGVKYSASYEGGCATGWSTDSSINCTAIVNSVNQTVNDSTPSTNYLPEVVYSSTNYIEPWRNGSMVVFYSQILDQEDDEVFERIDCGETVQKVFNSYYVNTSDQANATMYLSRTGEVIPYTQFATNKYWFNPYQYPDQWRSMSWNLQQANNRECKTQDYGRTCETFFGCVYRNAGVYTVSLRLADDQHQFIGNTGINWYTEKTWIINMTSDGNVNVIEVLINTTDTREDELLPSNNNAIKNFFNLDFIKNLGIGYTALWFLIMIILAVTIWVYGQGSPVSTGIIVFTEMLMIILGTYLGFIGIGIIIVLTIVSLAVLVVYMRNLFLGTSG